jgi:hypothetical protein
MHLFHCLGIGDDQVVVAAGIALAAELRGG